MQASDAEIAEVLADAGVVAVKFSPLNRGGDKSTCRVETAERSYVLQFYERTAAAARYALPFVAWIAARGYPTPAPRPMQSGGWLHRGRLPAAVFPFVEGTHPPVATIPITEQMGAALARLHRMARGYDRRLPTIDRLQLIRDAMVAAKAHESLTPWSEVAVAFLRENEKRWRNDLARLPSGPVHHDFHTDNLLVLDDVLTSVLDFDEVQRSPFVIDIARALHYFAEEAPDFRLPRTVAEAFIRGYETSRLMQENEHDALDLAFQLANLAHVAFSMLDTLDRPASLEESVRHRVYLANQNRLLT